MGMESGAGNRREETPLRFFESFGCGCTSPQTSKSDLAGYCGTHGKEAQQVYRADGKLIWDHRRDTASDHPNNRKAAIESATPSLDQRASDRGLSPSL